MNGLIEIYSKYAQKISDKICYCQFYKIKIKNLINFDSAKNSCVRVEIPHFRRKRRYVKCVLKKREILQ